MSAPFNQRPPHPPGFQVGGLSMQSTMIGKLRGLPDLNFDILLQIMSHLTYLDVARLTRTCHTLRVALSAELPRREVTVEGRHLTSFLMFASVKDGKDRLSYLHKLILPGSTYNMPLSSGDQAMSTKGVKRALSVILKLAASALESLSILDLDAFSFGPLGLKKILDSLPRLRELEMSGVGKKYQNALVNTLPRLRTLTFAFLEDEANASPFFKVAQSDLQVVTLRNGTFHDAFISFPTVHTLRACPANFPSDVDAYTRIFPNVQNVILDFPRDYGRLEPEFLRGVRKYHPRREWSSPHVQNWRARLLSRSQSLQADAWPHLRSIRAVGYGAGNLGWAGLACRVARLEMSGPQWIREELAGVLNELRPRCVVLHPGSFDWPYKRLSGDSRGSRWPQLIAFCHAPFVTRLTVVMCRAVGWGFVSQPQWLTWFCRYLEKTSISCLLIRLDYEYAASEERSDRFETWRAAMTHGIPSLRVLLFQVEDEVAAGWVKKERTEDWKEMNAGARRKFLASENLCPVSIEPCEECESRASR